MNKIITLGQEAGGMELLRDPFEVLLSESKRFANDAFMAHGWGTLRQNLPNFSDGIKRARIAASMGMFHRSQMPVIDEPDLPDLKQYLAGTYGYSVGYSRVDKMKPTQCQIYVDKAVGGTAKFGIVGTKAFLDANHTVTDINDEILDGHHRWLTGMTISHKLEVPHLKINATLDEILPSLLKFSDARHERNK